MKYRFASIRFAMCWRQFTISSCVMVVGVPCAMYAIDIHIKTPQSYAFSCFGEFSGPVISQSVHVQIGVWYIRYASSTSVLSARTYLVVFRAGFALEFCITMVFDRKSKVTDHQCSVPLGFNGKTSKSNSSRGMFLMAAVGNTASRSCAPHAVGKYFNVIMAETM